MTGPEAQAAGEREYARVTSDQAATHERSAIIERCALFANRSQKRTPRGPADWAYNQACIDIENKIRQYGRGDA